MHKQANYLRMNKGLVRPSNYIFKMRVGNDGSRENLFRRHLIDGSEKWCG